MLDAKIYGLCLERIKHQILNARTRGADKVLLETYCTADTGEIVDILELYDLENKTDEELWEKLDELATTVSLLLGHQLKFAYAPDGEIGLFVVFRCDREGIGLADQEKASKAETGFFDSIK